MFLPPSLLTILPPPRRRRVYLIVSSPHAPAPAPARIVIGFFDSPHTHHYCITDTGLFFHHALCCATPRSPLARSLSMQLRAAVALAPPFCPLLRGQADGRSILSTRVDNDNLAPYLPRASQNSLVMTQWRFDLLTSLSRASRPRRNLRANKPARCSPHVVVCFNSPQVSTGGRPTD